MPKTHQKSKTPEYISWCKMINRCYNQNAINYARYGGRGILMCPEWRSSFEAFLKDVGPKPSPLHTIERKDNSLGYCKSNCIWATPLEQGNNKRNNLRIILLGHSKTLSQWCAHFRLNYDITRQRIIRDGWTIERAIVLEPKFI